MDVDHDTQFAMLLTKGDTLQGWLARSVNTQFQLLEGPLIKYRRNLRVYPNLGIQCHKWLIKTICFNTRSSNAYLWSTRDVVMNSSVDIYLDKQSLDKRLFNAHQSRFLVGNFDVLVFEFHPYSFAICR